MEEQKKKEAAATSKVEPEFREITKEEFEASKKKPEKVEEKVESEVNETDEKEEKLKGLMPNKLRGSDTANYSWFQIKIEEITVQVKVPLNIKSNDLSIKYTKSHLLVQIRGQEPLIDGDFPHKILVYC